MMKTKVNLMKMVEVILKTSQMQKRDSPTARPGTDRFESVSNIPNFTSPGSVLDFSTVSVLVRSKALVRAFGPWIPNAEGNAYVDEDHDNDDDDEEYEDDGGDSDSSDDHFNDLGAIIYESDDQEAEYEQDLM